MLSLSMQITLSVAVLIGFYSLACYVAFERPSPHLPKTNPLISGDIQTPKEGMWAVVKLVVVLSVVLSVMVFVLVHVSSLGKVLIYGATFVAVTQVLVLLSSGNMFDSTNHGMKRFAWRLAFGAVITFVWSWFTNWFTQDLVNLAIGLFMLTSFRNITLKQSIALSAGVLIYDAVAVFFSGQMIKLVESTQGIPFGAVTVPQTMSLSAEPILMLGLGDIVLPGAIILIGYRLYGKRGGAYSIAGYLAGSAVALWVLVVAQFPQPATIYLMPGAYLGLWYASRFAIKRPAMIAAV